MSLYPHADDSHLWEDPEQELDDIPEPDLCHPDDPDDFLDQFLALPLGPAPATALDIIPRPRMRPEPLPLTIREREIARLVAEALSNKEIAGRLILSEQTVKNHLHNIFEKLGVEDRTSLTLWVVRSLSSLEESAA